MLKSLLTRNNNKLLDFISTLAKGLAFNKFVVVADPVLFTRMFKLHENGNSGAGHEECRSPATSKIS